MELNIDYWPEILQVIPTDDYKVYLYFNDGYIRLYDASDLVQKGIFKQLQENNLFVETCTVINHTLAWTPDRSYREDNCLDLDPVVLYKTCPIVEEPLHLFNL